MSRLRKEKNKYDNKRNAKNTRERNANLREHMDILLGNYRCLVCVFVCLPSSFLSQLQVKQKDEYLNKMYVLVQRAADVIKQQKQEIYQLRTEVEVAKAQHYPPQYAMPASGVSLQVILVFTRMSFQRSSPHRRRNKRSLQQTVGGFLSTIHVHNAHFPDYNMQEHDLLFNFPPFNDNRYR